MQMSHHIMSCVSIITINFCHLEDLVKEEPYRDERMLHRRTESSPCSVFSPQHAWRDERSPDRLTWQEALNIVGMLWSRSLVDYIYVCRGIVELKVVRSTDEPQIPGMEMLTLCWVLPNSITANFGLHPLGTGGNSQPGAGGCRTTVCDEANLSPSSRPPFLVFSLSPTTGVHEESALLQLLCIVSTASRTHGVRPLLTENNRRFGRGPTWALFQNLGNERDAIEAPAGRARCIFRPMDRCACGGTTDHSTARRLHCSRASDANGIIDHVLIFN